MPREHDYLEGFTQVLWSHQDLARGLKLSRGHLYRLLDREQMLPPDVIVLPDSYGWLPERARSFGKDIDRLDEDGNVIPQTPSSTLDKEKASLMVRTRYAKEPQVYLSSWFCSYMYGFNASTVYFIRKRGDFAPANVLIGKDKYGWDELRAIEIGEQTGRLDDEKIDRWLIRRTAYYGMSPEADWVKQRIQERPHLAKRLESAIETFQTTAYENTAGT